jgi:sulfatase maturation enzyme AslB (radical SAM superfamily)
MEPKIIELGVTTRCNLNNCAFCFRSQSKVAIPKIDLDIEVIKRAFNKEFLKKVETLSLVGSMGDIMLYPYTFELIDHLAENCREDMVLCIDTNASAKPKEWWQEFARRLNQLKSYHVRFAIDGLKDTHELYRIGTNFNTVINNMQTFINAGGKATWKFIVFKHNEHQIDEASKKAKEMGCIIFMVIISGIHNEDLKESSIYKMGTYPGILCRSLDTNYISIDADGDVMPCCWYKPIKNELRGEKIYWNDIKLMAKYFKNKSRLNIHTSTIDEAMQTDFFKYIYDNHRYLRTCQNFCGQNRRRPDNIRPRLDVFIETPVARKNKC